MKAFFIRFLNDRQKCGIWLLQVTELLEFNNLISKYNITKHKNIRIFHLYFEYTIIYRGNSGIIGQGDIMG